MSLANVSDHRWVSKEKEEEGPFLIREPFSTLQTPPTAASIGMGPLFHWDLLHQHRLWLAGSCLDGKVLCLEHVGEPSCLGTVSVRSKPMCRAP